MKVFDRLGPVQADNDDGDHGPAPGPAPSHGDDQLSLMRLLLPSAVIALAGTVGILYVVTYGFRTGLDSSSSAYRSHWYTLLAAELLVLVPAMQFGLVTLVRSRCGVCQAQRSSAGRITAEHELWHIWRLFGLLVAVTVAGFALALDSIPDTAWHQSTLRDSAFTPFHILSMYGTTPVFIHVIVASYLYARTRLPDMFGPRRGIPLAYILWGGVGLFSFLGFSFNEFGHSNWIYEERISLPIHWPFMAIEWGIVGVFAIAVPLARRVGELLREDLREAGT